MYKLNGKKTYLVILRDFTNEALERELADEELGALLVSSDFAQRHGPRPETMRLFDHVGVVVLVLSARRLGS